MNIAPNFPPDNQCIVSKLKMRTFECFIITHLKSMKLSNLTTLENKELNPSAANKMKMMIKDQLALTHDS